MSDKQKSIVVSLSADTARLQADMARAASAVSANTDKISKSFASVNIVSATMGKAFGAATAAFGAGQLIALADSYTRIEGRLKLVTNSSLELADVQARLQAIAQSSRSEYIATAEVFTRFAQATKGQGIAQEELLSITESLNKAFVISGASTAEAQAAMIQLSQGFASGVLRGDEFNSVMEQGGRVIDMLTNYTGKNRGELRAMAEQGEITADVLRGAFLKGAQAVNKEFSDMPDTVSRAGAVLSNTLGMLVHDADKGSGATKDLASSIIRLSDTVDENRDTIISLFVGVVDAAGWAIERVSALTNSVKGMAAVAAGVLDLSDFVFMDRGELKSWMTDFDNGAGLLKKRLSDAKEELKKFQEQDTSTVDEAGFTAAFKKYEGLKKELQSIESAQVKVSKATAASTVQVDLSGKVSQKVFEDIRKNFLPLEEEQRKYKDNLKNIADLEKNGQLSADQAATARLNAAKELSSYKEREKAEKKAEADAKKAGKKGDTDAASAMRKGEQFYQQTLDKLLPLEKAQRDYNEQLAALEVMDPTKGTERYQEALGNLTAELQKVQDAHSGVDAARAAAESDISARTTRLASSVASGAITETAALPFEIDLLRQRLTLQQDHLNTLQKSTPQEISAYNSQVEAIERVNLELVEKERLLRLKDGWEGAKQALSDYGEMAANMGAQVSDAVTGAFSGMEDAMVEFVTKGKLDFASLADSILADMARIAVRQSITGPLSTAIGGAIGSFFGGGGGATGATISSNFTSAAVYGSAKGNVFNSPGLSAYSNSIVSKPTLFPFASGIGLMGEAGPEGILPLKRINGVLGVNAEGAGGGTVIHQTISIDARGADSGVEQRIRQAAEEGARKGYQMVQTDIARRGPIYKGMR